MKEDLYLSEEEFASAKAYWTHQLAGGIDNLNITYDFSTIQDHRKDCYRMTFPGDLTEKIYAICKGQDLLVYFISVAVLKVLLFKYTGQNQITIGSPIYTTSDEYYDYNHCIPLIDVLNETMSFREILGEVRQTIVEGYSYQHFPLDKILEASPENSRNYNYTKLMMFHSDIHQESVIGDIMNSAVNDITFALGNEEKSLVIKISYDSGKFRQETIHRLFLHYVHIFNQAISNKDMKLRDIDCIPEEEKTKLLNDFNQTPEADASPPMTIDDLFEEQAARSVDHAASGYKDMWITYGDLNLRSGQLAGRLRERGVGNNVIAGIMVDYSQEMVIGILGILKAGGAYLPVDIDYPQRRIQYMLEDADVDILLTQKTAPPLDFFGTMMYVEDLVLLSKHVDHSAGIRSPGDLAYIIYTSGSTGRPKGVMIEHGGLVNYATWKIRNFAFTPDDKTLQLISLSFDGFGANLYPSLLSGGTLILPDGKYYADFKYVNRLIKNQRVTHMSVVPIMYRAALENVETDELESLRIVILAGEKASAELIKLSRTYNEDIILINEYGPTECTITAAAHIGMTADDVGIIGKPIANTRILILDKNHNLLPVNVPGELCISGKGLSRGYCDRPELTSARFVQNPMFPGEVMYKTGDHARWRPESNLEFRSRIDHQVKIRGFRVEPEEIESAMTNTGSVKEVAVVDLKDLYNNTYLCAYFSAADEIKTSALREGLSTTLPDYMIPSRFIQLEALPLTATGKLDRKALPDPEEFKSSGEKFVAPTSEMEKNLSNIWRDVLKVDPIGINDNFFDLGGNSILLMQVNARVETLYPGYLTITDFFTYPTIARLSQYLEKKDKNLAADTPIEIDTIPLPEEYFHDHRSSSVVDFRFQISGELLEKMRVISQKEGVTTAHVLVSVYAFLWAKISQQPRISLQTLYLRPDWIIPINLDLSNIKDLSEFLQQLLQIQTENENRGYHTDDIGRIKRKMRDHSIVPLFLYKGMLDRKVNLLDVYDILLEVEEENDRLNLVCKFNGHLKEQKIEEFIQIYVNLNNQMILGYMEDSRK